MQHGSESVQSTSSVELMSAARMARTIRRLAYEMVEYNKGKDNLLLFGVDERGFALAQRLQAELKLMLSAEIPTYLVPVRKQEIRIPKDVDLTARYIVVVDDVIFSGHSMKHALEQILQLGAPAHVDLAVLIDRGHRKYPLEPRFVGLKCPTKFDEHVEVRISSSENVKDGVSIHRD